MTDIISKNPFRLLGVTVNASPSEILRNKNRMNAFLKVNKPVNFPYDLSDILGAPERTAQTVTEADTTLTVKEDRMRAAQFWWFGSTAPVDETAFRHLASGDIDAAIGVWQKVSTMSSLANAAVGHLIKGNYHPAAVALSQLYGQYAQDFANAVDVPSATRDTLVSSFVSTLVAEFENVDASMLTGSDYPDWWNESVRSAIVTPIVAKLNEAIKTAKDQKGKGYRNRFKAGIELDATAAPLLRELRKVVKITDIELVSISDKVANEILQCSIDAYNEAEDLYFAPDALKLLRKAKRVAMGAMVKQRIKENEDTIVDLINSLPPAEVKAENDELEQLTARYSKMAQSVDNASSYFSQATAILKRIGAKLPADKKDYLINRNSGVVNFTLGMLVGCVNSVQTGLHENINKDAFIAIRETIYRARQVTLSLQSLTVDTETQNRLNQNLSVITDIANSLSQVKTEKSLGDYFSGCWTYILIIVIISLIRSCIG